MLFGLLVILFVLVCIILCFLILIQSDKGGGISSALGGGLGGASNLLGTQDTANILTRGTTLFITVFFILCIILSFVLGKRGEISDKSLLKQRAEKLQNFSPSSVINNNVLPIKGEEGDKNTNKVEEKGGENQVPSALPILPSGENSKEDNKK